MPSRKSDDELKEEIIQRQKEQELKAKLKEAKEARRKRIDEAKERSRARRQRTYTVQAGDTLGKIAQELYKDGSRWTEIYEANKDKIADPDVIEVGLKLVIP
jgi:nucleoid-associated protein YgaU